MNNKLQLFHLKFFKFKYFDIFSSILQMNQIADLFSPVSLQQSEGRREGWSEVSDLHRLDVVDVFSEDGDVLIGGLH